MSTKTYRIVLTQAEGDHLIALLTRDQLSGEYSGVRRHYDAITRRLIRKLERAEDVSDFRVCQHIGTEGECPR